METINKKVVIYRKTDTSYFAKINAKVLPEGASKIGPSINAVNSMTVKSDMLQELMPNILGVSDSESDFTRMVTNYWNSLSVNISENGKILEVGFNYILDSNKKKKNISSLKDKDDKPIKFKDDKHLANYVESNVSEDDKWKYAEPINTADYLLWRYCMNYGDVANTLADRDKSPKIRFYIHDEYEAKRIERSKLDLKKKAGKIYFNIIEDADKVSKYLLALGEGSTSIVMDEIDRYKLLEKVYNDNPQRIIDASQDKLLDKKAFIEECILNGVLRRLPNSSVIVNASDNAPIGDSIEDAIAYLDAESNVKAKNEIEGRLRSLQVK